MRRMGLSGKGGTGDGAPVRVLAVTMVRSHAEFIAQADRLVAHGEAMCKQQAALLRWWWARGWDTTEAEALLARLEQDLSRTRLYRAQLQGDDAISSLAPWESH